MTMGFGKLPVPHTKHALRPGDRRWMTHLCAGEWDITTMSGLALGSEYTSLSCRNQEVAFRFPCTASTTLFRMVWTKLTDKLTEHILDGRNFKHLCSFAESVSAI